MIETLLAAMTVYLAAGLLFALVFQAAGLRRVDPATAGAGWGFRLLVTPGLVALWPWLALRWRRALRGEETAGGVEAPIGPRALRTGHRRLAWALLLVVPIAGAALTLRPAPAPAGAPRLFAALAGEPPAGEVLESESRAFGDLPIALEVRRSEDGGRSVVLDVTSDLEQPALGLYLGAEAVPDGTSLPAGAIFLGAVYGPARLSFELPAAEVGSLWLYSLAHAELVARHDLATEAAAEAEG
ncbi:MAG: hypothetical protein KDD11_13150 [Acidobacteria bacterium]|nr:hypothetical protein [Acidobacteriota bacterium]